MGRIERGEAFAFRQLSTRLQVLLNRAPLPMYADALEFDGAEENGSSPLPRLQTPLWAVALSPATLETDEAILVVDRTDPTPNYARTLAHGVLAFGGHPTCSTGSCPEAAHATTQISGEDMGCGSSSTHGVRFQAWWPSYLFSP